MPNDEPKKSQFEELRQSDLVEQVRDKLIAAISTGELAPGQRIVEAELARRMGISRGPIREAARLLQQWGILSSQARRGFFVRRVSLEEIDNLVDYRICLETYAARKAIKRATSRDVRRLRALYEDVLAAEKRRDKDPLAALECTFAFHTHLFELSGNPRLVEAFNSLLVQIRQIATLVNLADEASEWFFGSYLLPIVEAFEGGDPDSIVDAVSSYLTISRDATKKFYMGHCHSD